MKPHRCPVCEHRPGPRVLSYVKAKAEMRDITPARQHKKPCHCACHGVDLP